MDKEFPCKYGEGDGLLYCHCPLLKKYFRSRMLRNLKEEFHFCVKEITKKPERCEYYRRHQKFLENKKKLIKAIEKL